MSTNTEIMFMDMKMNRQQEWYLLSTLVAVFGGRFSGRIGDYAHSARFQLKTAAELADGETERKRRLIGQADSLLSRMMNETELLLMACGCVVWSEEDEVYLEMMSQRLEPLEDGADGAATFSRAVLKERERFGQWLLAEDISLALNGLLVLAGRLRRLLRHERKRLAAELEEAKHRDLFPEAADAPKCPVCGSPMRLRTAKSGTNAGSRFWGCTQYPACRGVREIIDGNDMR
jgi:hypothetical protein